MKKIKSEKDNISEVVRTHSMSDFESAVTAAQNGEIAGVVMQVSEPTEMEAALIKPDDDELPFGSRMPLPGANSLFDPRLVKADLTEAAIRAHNASSSGTKIPYDHVFSIPISTFRLADTKFHPDSTGVVLEGHEQNAIPLNIHIQIIGKVATKHLILPTFDQVDLLARQAAVLDEGILDTIEPTIIGSGDVSVFGGFGDPVSGRFPVGHEFIALGSEAERAQRTSALINPGSLPTFVGPVSHRVPAKVH